jgi:hypothetical protein
MATLSPVAFNSIFCTRCVPVILPNPTLYYTGFDSYYLVTGTALKCTVGQLGGLYDVIVLRPDCSVMFAPNELFL